MAHYGVHVIFHVDVDRNQSSTRAERRSVSSNAAVEALMRIHDIVFESLAERLTVDGFALRQLDFEESIVEPLD